MTCGKKDKNMILPLGEREEILVIDSSKKLMMDLRLAILQEFPRTWVLLYYDSVEDMYGIELCNVSGGRLALDKEESIREYIENFMQSKKAFE